MMKHEDKIIICIREAHPLKQGLKQATLRFLKSGSAIREAHPLKQGLKRHYEAE